MQDALCLVGLDVGSTTVKIVVTEANSEEILFSRYRRHNTFQAATAAALLREAHAALPLHEFSVAVCGSGGEPIAKAIGANFVQEVTAMALIVARMYPTARTAIELGGQDAKVVTFVESDNDREIVPGPMRMNGACAGGTGAFIDQIAALLNVSAEEFEHIARRGSHVYDVSGRCGVFAKTDIQPLLNSGAAREDLALSAFHAIARQTIGGLAQGLTLRPDVVFAGGPLMFNDTLVRVFREQLQLEEFQCIRPMQAHLLVAHGAALSNAVLFGDSENRYHVDRIEELEHGIPLACEAPATGGEVTLARPFFADRDDHDAFSARHGEGSRLPIVDVAAPHSESAVGPLWLGVDAGSTTSKFVLIDDEGRVAYSHYRNNEGDPLNAFFSGFRDLASRAAQDGSPIEVAGIGVTGYGAELLSTALAADHRCVETVAHARAAREADPEVTSIIDIGGQDMKVIFLQDGVVSDIIINEACSAGCGSFLESYAASLGVELKDVAATAFTAKEPAQLGSRCTVFMNSAVITEQKRGRTREDILAGICNSVVENVFGKVLRPHNVERLGDHVVVQGGTYRNDAVLRATELYLKKPVIRPRYSGHMGAIGAALLTKETAESHNGADSILPASQTREEAYARTESILTTTFVRERAPNCTLCANHCVRSVVRFSHGGVFISGNRCERGAVLEASPPRKRDVPSEYGRTRVHNLFATRTRAVFADYAVKALSPPRGITIGLPRVLEMWESAPFWSTLFRALGFTVVFSPLTTQKQFESGLPYVSSDTICLPAKITHGHILALDKRGADVIFLPQMHHGLRDNKNASGAYYCAILEGYSMVLETMHDLGKQILHPIFHWFTPRIRNRQITEFLFDEFGIESASVRRAIAQADAAMHTFRRTLVKAGKEALTAIRESGSFGIVLASRPYHLDRFLNHDVARQFTDRGIHILIPETLPRTYRRNLRQTRMESTITYHNRVIEAAMSVAENPQLELVQLVSFGCGHDAIISDEATRILREHGARTPLVLKLDDVAASGPLKLRIDSFIETVRVRRRIHERHVLKPTRVRGGVAFGPRFNREHRRQRTIYIPVLTLAFSACIAAIVERRGYKVRTLPAAGPRAVELGKRYVHNDMCFPAQINVGEFLAEVEAGRINPRQAVLGLAKNCESCRAGQYTVVARKALDDAGYTDVPIVTTGTDSKRLHPAFRLNVSDMLKLLWSITIVDELERMRRRVRPYEAETGSADRLFERCVEGVTRSIVKSHTAALQVLETSVRDFNALPLTDGPRRPRVGIVGEILINNHPTANLEIERYLESHGMEVVLPDLHLFFRKNEFINRAIAARKWIPFAGVKYLYHTLFGSVYDAVRRKVLAVGSSFRFVQPATWVSDIAHAVEGLIDVTYRGAEGWKLPGEILTMASEGIRSFVIVQPFGCIPNHVTGRGFIKAVLQKKPDLQIVSIDYDPDTSRANVENRLQMLIMREKIRIAADRRKNEHNWKTGPNSKASA